jgi:hypothetical protein
MGEAKDSWQMLAGKRYARQFVGFHAKKTARKRTLAGVPRLPTR